MSCPDQAIERVEEISYLIKNSGKNGSVVLEDFVRMHDERAYAQHNEDVAAGTASPIAQLRQMFKASGEAAAAGGDEEEAAGPTLGLVQDICGLNKHVFN